MSASPQQSNFCLVEEDHPIYEAWVTYLEDKIWEFLNEDKLIGPLIEDIMLLREGPNPIPESNPITIVINIDKSVNPSQWVDAETGIKNILQEYQQNGRHDSFDVSEIEVVFDNFDYAEWESDCALDEWWEQVILSLWMAVSLLALCWIRVVKV